MKTDTTPGSENRGTEEKPGSENRGTRSGGGVPPGSENRGAEGGGGWRVRLWLPVTQGRPHAVALANHAEALELARAKEGGGHHTDYDVVRVEIEYPGRRAE